MAIPVESLTETHYKILQHFYNNGLTERGSLTKQFPLVEALDLRLQELSTPKYTETYVYYSDGSKRIESPRPALDTSYLIKRGDYTYYISDLGKKALQDYNIKRKADNKNVRRSWWQMLCAGALGFLLSLVAQFLFWKIGLLS